MKAKAFGLIALAIMGVAFYWLVWVIVSKAVR